MEECYDVNNPFQQRCPFCGRVDFGRIKCGTWGSKEYEYFICDECDREVL